MSKLMNQIQEATFSIKQARDRMAEKACSLSIEETLFKPAPEKWSASQILEHVYICEILVLSSIWKLRGETAILAEQTIEHPTQTFDDIIRPYASQKAMTLPPLVPSGTGTAGFWIEALRANQRIVNALPRLLLNATPDKIVFSHFIAGPLNSIQWLHFLSWHLDRHRVQIEYLGQASTGQGV